MTCPLSDRVINLGCVAAGSSRGSSVTGTGSRELCHGEGNSFAALRPAHSRFFLPHHFGAHSPCDNIRMAATVVEGTARKRVDVNDRTQRNIAFKGDSRKDGNLTFSSTKEELEHINTAQSVSGMFLSGGIPMGDPAYEVHLLTKKYNPPEGSGLNIKTGEFMLP